MAFVIPKKPATMPVLATSEPVSGNAETRPASEPVPMQEIPKTVAPQAASKLDLLILTNLESLTKKLEAAIPDIRQEMITIHKELAKDPAQVAILSQEECAIIFKGYSKLSGIELVAKAAAKKGSKQPVSFDMFE